MSKLFRGTIFESCVVLVKEPKSGADVHIGLETDFGKRLCVDMVTDRAILIGGNVPGTLDGSERLDVVMVLELTTVIDESGSNVGQETGAILDSVGVVLGRGVCNRRDPMVLVLGAEINEVNAAAGTKYGVGDAPRTPGSGVVMAFVLNIGGLETESLITDDN